MGTGAQLSLSCSVAVLGEDRKWLMGRSPGPQLGRAFFRSLPITDDFHFTIYLRRLWDLCLWEGALPAISCDLGHSCWDEALFAQMENWAGPRWGSGETIILLL